LVRFILLHCGGNPPAKDDVNSGSYMVHELVIREPSLMMVVATTETWKNFMNAF
jgi:hypothetical protein